MNELKNKGIYGYSDSKNKKIRDVVYDALNVDENNVSDEFMPSGKLSEVDETIERVGRVTDALGDKDKRSLYYYNAAKENIVPTDNEQRRRRQFVLSQNVANDVIGDFYDNEVKPEFDRQRTKAEGMANDAYRQSVSVPGSDPMSSLGIMRNAADPEKVMNSTIDNIDNEKLDSVARAYANYGGLDADSYRDNILKPGLKSRMTDEYIKAGVPRNSLEYIGRSAFDNSLTGKLVNLSLDGYSGNKTQRFIDDEAMNRYDANRVEDFAAGVGSLFVDTGAFAGLGGFSSKIAGKATSLISGRLASKVLAKGASRGITGETAQRIVDRTFLNNLSTRIAQSGAVQGMTLGAYDATNSVVDDLLYGNDVNIGKVVGSFSKGMGIGAMLGSVGTPLRQAAQGLTGGKKIAASAGVLSAESAVFTLGTELEKAAYGVDIEPVDLFADFGESAATLTAMRLAHWRPKGYREKLNVSGNLKPELSFNSVERQEIREAGVNPEQFISSLEYELKPRYSTLHGNARRDFIRNYGSLMSDKSLSASTRAKLMYIVENKITTTPPVPSGYSMGESENGHFVDITDNAGRKVERFAFDTRDGAVDFVERNYALLRRNRIASLEEQLGQSVDSENFFRQAGMYARETGTDINDISVAMYKKAKNKSLDSREKQLLDDIMQRSSFNDAELGNVMYNIRSIVEKRYRLPKGTLLTSIDKNFRECNVMENAALDEYESLVGKQVELIRNGISSETHDVVRDMAVKNNFEGYGSEQIKDYERFHHDANFIRSGLDKGLSPYPEDGEPRIGPDENYKSHRVHYLHSNDEISRMATLARKMAKQLNLDVDFVFDIRQLSFDDPNYADKVFSKGWYNRRDNKVTINLAANKNSEDVGYTVLHELVGHKGLAELFGERYDDFLKELLTRSTPQVRKAVNSLKGKGVNDLMAMDEYLAQIAEKRYNTAEERGILGRFKDFIGSMMFRMNIPVRDMNESKIRSLIQQHGRVMGQNIPVRERRNNVFGTFASARKESSSNNGWNAESSMLPEITYRFIGEKGLQNLKKKKRRNFDSESLGVAKQYEKWGLSDYYIKAATGWERGGDGKWRYEIDDSHINVKFYPEERLKEQHPDLYSLYLRLKNNSINGVGPNTLKKIERIEKFFDKHKNVKLSDVVPDRYFFDAYPEYRDVKVIYRRMSSKICAYDPGNKILYINLNLIGTPKLNRAVASQMQKMIQRSEGFSEAYPLKSVLPGDVYDEINKPIDFIDMFGLDKNRVSSELKDDDKKRLEFYDKYNSLPEEIPGEATRRDDFRLLQMMPNSAAQSGNVERRNVQRRLDMSEQERMFSPSYSTEDVERKYQVHPKDIFDLQLIMSGPIDIIRSKGVRWKRWEDRNGEKDIDPELN